MRDDQAAGLRRLFAPRHAVLGVAGVDSTPLVVDLAASLAELGRAVLVVDRTRGEATATARGRGNRYELADVLAGDLALAQVLEPAGPGVTILPAARGFDELALDHGDFARGLAPLLAQAGLAFDVWLVNGLLPSSDGEGTGLIAIAPTAAAVTAAYAQMKALAHCADRRRFEILVHGAASENAARALYESVADTARRFLSAELGYRGFLPAACGRAAPERRRALMRLAEGLLPAPRTH